MNKRQSAVIALLLVGGCLAPHYGVDTNDSPASGGSAGSGQSGNPAKSGGGPVNAGGADSAGGDGLEPGRAGDSSEAGSPPVVTCDASQKMCEGKCVDISDVTYGCGMGTCNQSGCPADSEAVLGCDGEACVPLGCEQGFKLCDSRCVSESDPTFGCGPTACDDAACPNPGAGTLTCMDGACVVRDCKSDSKKCGNKCVPKNEDNGCSADECAPCASNEVCDGEPSTCTCIPNGDACAGFECGSATDSCGETKACRNDCAGTSEPYCIGNTCRECKSVSDCKAPADNPCFKAACVDSGCTLTVPAANTPCSGGGKCSTTAPGVCERPSIKVGPYDIDATEVTRGQYDLFLKAKGGNTSGQVAACSWNTSYTPTANWPASVSSLDYPITYIDWCDASAYCKWTGRRLCGKLGGGPADHVVDHDGTISQWVHACLPATGGPFPYGKTFDVDACNGKKLSYDPAPVASFGGCVGGLSGLFDMSGNVTEWEDSCSAYKDADDYCSTQGGAFGSVADDGVGLQCQDGVSYHRNVTAKFIGLRCCSNP
jgi:sulfatase modifying factor 1